MVNDSSKIKIFLKSSVILIISNICLKSINFFLLPLYTTYLTSDILGVSDVITSFTGLIFPFLVLGLDSAFSAFYFEKNDQNREKKVFNTIALTLFALSGLPIIASFFSRDISLLLFGNEERWLAVLIALLSIVFNLWYLPFSLELRLQNKMMLFGAINIGSSFIMILLNILFVSVLKWGVYSLILSTSIVNLMQFIFYISFTGIKIRKEFLSFELLKKMFIFALPIIPSTLMVWILSLSDRYLILHFLGESSAGIYGIGSRFVMMVNVVISGVSTAYTTFAFSNKNEQNSKLMYVKILRLISFLLLGICFTVSLFSSEIITIMAHESYRSSYLLLRDLMFAQLLYAIMTIVSYGIFFEKKPIYSLFANAAGALINLVLNIILIPKYGIQAAAFTTLIGYFVALIFTYTASQKLYYCNYKLGKILLISFGLYICSFITFELELWIKIIVWIASAAITTYLFKDAVSEVISLIKLKRKK